MKRLIGLLAGLVLFGNIGLGPAAAGEAPLANLDFHVVGVGLEAGPEYQAVPKGIATRVDTGIGAQGFDVDLIISQLPKDYRVKAELTGPAFLTPLTLTALPGKPFDIPTLALLGKHTLNNIRLVDGTGKTLFGAVPQAVIIESINDPLVTEVRTRQLTLEEIKERGVVFDSSNFTAYEFTVAIATESGQVPLSLPVAIPDQKVLVDLPAPGGGGIPLPPPQNLPPSVQVTQLPQNLAVAPIVMKVKEGEELPEEIKLPPIPGILVIPGNIGFLHQYFSALALVTNGAPENSGLTIRDIEAKLILPAGEDRTPGTDEVPGDDPLRMAKGAEDFFPRNLPVRHAGSDGKVGTADDISRLYPAETGQADFTIEGLKEGTHKLDFEITATLAGLPIGDVTLIGHASGAVLVRNPDFSVTMSHPATVRSGEGYDLFLTVTNTGKTIANLVSLYLDPRALSGTVFAEGETPDKELETILPGSSATVRYRLVSQRTGAVTATVFVADEGVKGRFNLRTGVGERGIPLSPDSLILPYIGDLDADLVDAVVGLLGQAWSVATAPAGALPADVRPIAKQTVADRAFDFSEAGLRILIGDTPARALADFTFDLFGSDKAVAGLDHLRRQSTQGSKVNQALGAIFRGGVDADGLFHFQADFAAKVSYRPGHISVITGEAPVRVRLSDASGNRAGGLTAEEPSRELPFADQLVISDTGSARSTLTLVTKLDSPRYELELIAEGAAVLDLGIVLPDASGVLRQWRFAGVSLPAGARASASLLPGSADGLVLAIDENGDGSADRTVVAGPGLAIPDGPPQIVAATQIVPGFGPGGDKHGRNVAILFSETVTPESAGNVLNYGVDTNEIKTANLQPGGRMAFLLLRDGIGPFFERTLTADGLVDRTGSAMAGPESLAIRATATGPAAVVDGVVREANGAPLPRATVRLLQKIVYDDGFSIEERWAIFSEKQAEEDGSYHFDYVFRNDNPAGPFMIEAVHPTTGEAGQATASVIYHGQGISLDIFMRARGRLSGVVRNEAGNPVGGATVQVTTLNDGRRYNATSDAAGAYAFSGISVGPFNLKAAHQASLTEGSTMGVLPEEGGAVVQDVTLYALGGVAMGSVSGTVLDADGTAPRAGVVVIVRGDNYQNWMRSGADGGFVFSGVYAGNITLEAWDETSGEAVQVKGSVSQDLTSVFKIILPGTGRVEGQVLRDDGGSAEGLYVIAAYGRGLQHKQVQQTDAQGNFSLPTIPVGKVTLQVLDPRDFNRQVASATVTLFSAGETVAVPLFVQAQALATGTIQGTVYRRDGSVWPFADIRLADLANMTYVPYKADGQGKYAIANAALKTHSLVVVKGSEVVNATTSLWYGGQVKTLDLRAAAIGAVSGTTYDDPEKTYPTGADVSLISRKPNAMGWLVYDSSRPTVVKSDPQTGRFLFTGVYEGSFTVQTSNVFRPTPVTVSGVLTAAKPTADVALVLQGTVQTDPGSGSGGSGSGSGSGGSTAPVNALGSISGEVLLPDGSPVGEGVRLTAWIGGAEVVVTTDAAGKFQFRPILPAGNHRVEAFDPVTTLTWQGNVSVPANGDAALTARLLGRGSLTVRVLEASGTPAAGAAVSATGAKFPYNNASGTTNEEGKVTFDNLTEGTYAISAAASFGRGAKGQGTITGDGAAISADLTLTATGTVTGTFFKADGKTPVPGGRITLKRSGATVGFATTSSDPETPGRFVLEYVPLGSFNLEGFDPTTERIGKSGGNLASNGETVTANIVVGPRGLVKGVVLNHSGTMPIDRAGVTIQASGYNYTTTTGPDGAFIFAGVPAGAFTLDARDPANGLHGKASGTISYEGETAPAELRIAPTGSIEGRVLLPDRTTPATSATVTLQGKQVQIDPVSGGFTFANLAAGTSYSLSATENNTRRVGTAVVTIREDGEVAHAEIVLRGIGVVEGTVRESDGITPLPGAQVILQAGGIGTTDFSDFDGRYRFANVPQGSFSLKASHPQRQTAAAASGQIGVDGEVVTVDMAIGPIASVTGTVLLWDGLTPAAGGGVKFSGGGKEFTTVVDAAGRFTFGGIPIPCSFSLYIEDADGIGIGKAAGNLSVNGEVFDVGVIVLDEKPIAVTAVSPAPGSVDVPSDQVVKILFSEPADPASVTASSVYLARGSAKVVARLLPDPDHQAVTIEPEAPLAGMALYQVVVTTALKDRIGRTLASTFTSGFTTLDNVPPQVKSVSPASGQLQVAPDGVVRVTFSETIDPAQTEGMHLLVGGMPVAVRLDWTQGGTVAILTPLYPLQANATYTVQVSGTRDTLGNIQVGTFATSFNTIDTIPPTVTSLAVPAGADLITGNTVTVAAAVGDADVALVDFFLDGERVATDSSAPFNFQLMLSRSGEVQLKAIAQDKVGNRGAAILLTLSVADDQPPTVVFVSPAEGAVVDSGSAVTVMLTANDDLNAREVILSATGEVVSNQTRTNASGKSFTATFDLAVPPAANPGGTIVLAAVAKDSSGKASAAVQRTLYVRDGVAPSLVLSSPGQSVLYRPGEAGKASVTITDNAGTTELSCTASGPASGGQTWSFEPPAKEAAREILFDILAEAAPHANVTISCSGKDAAGNTGSKSLTLQVADIVPPKVTATNFADKTWGVETDSTLTVTFDEPLSAATVNGASVLLKTEADGEMISGTVSLSADKKVISFIPTALADDTRYALTVGASVADAAGNVLGEDRVIVFATLPANTAVIQNMGTESVPFVLAGGRYRTVFISNSNVVLGGPIEAVSFTLQSGSTVTHQQPGSPTTGRVDITADEVVIDATSKIDVTGKGYSGGYGDTPARTVGNTTTGGSTMRNGGSYGGMGGYNSGTVNATYGDLIDPNELGSGGGGYQRYDGWSMRWDKYSGGNGGGLVRIEAGSLQLEGNILADGGSSSYGGGSGGGIRIDVGVLNGTGKVYARGGSTTSSDTNHGAGGGGRIALYYEALNLPVGNILASGGSHVNNYPHANGGAGTVYLKDKAAIVGDLILNNNGNDTTRRTAVADIALRSVEVKGDAGVELAGTVTTESSMRFTNTTSAFHVSNAEVLPEDLTIDNSQISTLYGALNLNGTLKLQNNATLSSGTVRVNAGAIVIDAGSKIDVSGRGYAGASAANDSNKIGWTLGNTTSGGSTNRNGGSYGGLGGYYTGGSVNAVYGDPTDPNEYGSGGGGEYYGSSSKYPGGAGGGLIRLTTGSLVLNGEIKADGAVGSSYGGGGSGGGIRIDAGELSGSGKIYARGGNGNYESGGGGGGRVAVYYDTLTLSTSNILANGGGYNNYVNRGGGAGTIFLKENASQYGDLILNNNGNDTTRRTAVADIALRSVEVKGDAGVELAGTVTTESSMRFTNTTSAFHVSNAEVLPEDLTIDNSQISTLYGALNLNGTLKLQNNATLSSGTVRVNAGAIVIDAGSKIDVSGRGYLGAYQPGNSSQYGRTLGNVNGSFDYAGGSYGGLGGVFSGAVNAVYGNLTDPNEYGSGGGTRWETDDWKASNGGGLVRITAGTMQLNGAILADGAACIYGGAGSGGGVRIDAGTFSGNGTISATGGRATGSIGSGGGGGRIAIYYDSMTLPATKVIAAGGQGGYYNVTNQNGGAGSVYLKGNAADYGDLILNNGGLETSRTTPIPSMILNSLTVTGGAKLDYLDKTAPQVTGASIAAEATEVPVTAKIEVYFNEALAIETVTQAAVTLTDTRSVQAVSGAVTLSEDRKTIIFTPQSLMDRGRQYRLAIATTVTDLSRNSLAGGFILQFWTEGADFTPPQVVMTRPAGGAVTDRNDLVIFTLSDDQSGVDFAATAATAKGIDAVGNPMIGQWQWSEQSGELIFTPQAPLPDGDYWVTILPTDLAGNSDRVQLHFTVSGGLADADGIIAVYRMDFVNPDGTLVDERGRFPGTISGAATTTGQGGILGEALDFSAGGYAIIPQGVINGDAFGIAFFERTPSEAQGTPGALLDDSEHSDNLFLGRAPEGGRTLLTTVAGVDLGPGQLEALAIPQDQYNFVVLNKYRDGRVEIFVNDLKTPVATGSGSTFTGLLSDLWLGNRSDLQAGFIGRLDQLTIAIRPFDQAERQRLLDETRRGPIAHYTMDDGDPWVMTDLAGKFPGRIAGAVPVSGVSGMALRLVGAEGDQVMIPGIPPLREGSIVLSVNLADTASGVLLSNREGVTIPGMFQLDLVNLLPPGGNPRLLVHNGQIWSTQMVSEKPFIAGTQTIIVVAWDGYGKRLYLNGQLVASDPDLQPMFDPSSFTRLGNLYDLAWGMTGDVDELRIYDRALTSMEITILNLGLGLTP